MKPLQSFFAVVAGILATTAKTFCYRNLGSMPSSISTLTEQSDIYPVLHRTIHRTLVEKNAYLCMFEL